MFARIAARTGVQLPSPPAFARNVVESEGCRAVALAKADTVCIERLCCELRLGKPLTKKMPRFTYVYVLQSESNPEHFYTGRTDDLRDRLTRHNNGKVPHTAKWRPWRIKTYIALSDSERAAELEHYLKSASGRAFLKKRL
jgi:putative endonuclease